MDPTYRSENERTTLTPGLLSNSPDYLQVVVLNKEPLFYCTRDGPYYPTLRLLHQCEQWTCHSADARP